MADEKVGRKTLNVTHWRIFLRFWGSIFGTMTLVVVSTLLWLLQPYLLGRAIDGLVADKWIEVAYLGALQVGVLMIGMLRRYYDTRVYTRIYRVIGEEVITASQVYGLELTRLTARANMLREVVRFFEFRVPATIRSAINLVGSLALLALISTPIFYICVAGMGVVVLISLLFSGPIFRLNKSLNDQLEHEVDVFEARSPTRTEEHLAAIAGWQVKRSDVEVGMFGILNLTFTMVLLFSLYFVVSVQNEAIGTVFAVFSYVVRFQTAVNQFPAVYQESLRTLEITRRINQLGVIDPPKDEDDGDAEDGKREVARERRDARLIQFFAEDPKR